MPTNPSDYLISFGPLGAIIFAIISLYLKTLKDVSSAKAKIETSQVKLEEVYKLLSDIKLSIAEVQSSIKDERHELELHQIELAHTITDLTKSLQYVLVYIERRGN